MTRFQGCFFSRQKGSRSKGSEDKRIAKINRIGLLWNRAQQFPVGSPIPAAPTGSVLCNRNHHTFVILTTPSYFSAGKSLHLCRFDDPSFIGVRKNPSPLTNPSPAALQRFHRCSIRAAMPDSVILSAAFAHGQAKDLALVCRLHLLSVAAPFSLAETRTMSELFQGVPSSP